MRVTGYTRKALAVRREARDMKAAGWELVPGPWEMDRGGRQSAVITEAKVSVTGKHVWIKASDK